MTTIARPSSFASTLLCLVLAHSSAAAQGRLAIPGIASEEAVASNATALWGDLDGDGRLDALSITAEGRLRLLANRPEGFENVSKHVGLSGIDAVVLALWHDYDGDARADLFVGRSAGASLLLRNEQGSFVDMTAGTGLAIDEPVRAAHWLDEDGDGRLDLHVVTSTSNRVWRGLAGGFFEPVELPFAVAPGAPLPSPGPNAVARLEAGLAPHVVEPDEPGVLARPRPRTGRTPDDRVEDDPGAPRAGMGPELVGPSPSQGGATPLLSFPGGCASSIRDQANPGSCLTASSEATLGMLYPLSSKLFVEEATGEVGIGTTSPAYRLHVAGKIVSGTGNDAPGTDAAVGGGASNWALGDHATVGGGEGNAARSNGDVVGGGVDNLTPFLGAVNVIAGGQENWMFGTSAEANVISGGRRNLIDSSTGSANTIGGGEDNTIEMPFGTANTIAGGSSNTAGANSSDGNAVGGGSSNWAGASGSGYNTIGGGEDNTAGAVGLSHATVAGGSSNAATGEGAAVPGGRSNAASGHFSLAAGRRAKATHDGSFVWGDSQDLDKPSSADDEFNVYAEGGARVFAAGVVSPSMVVDAAGNVGVGTSTPVEVLHVEGKVRSAGANGGQFTIFNPNNQNASAHFSWLSDVARFRIGGSGAGANNGFDFQRIGDQSLLRILDNGNVGIGTTAPGFDLEVNGTAAKPGGGSWSVSSDARLKKDVEDLEGALATLLALRGVSFEYIDPAAIGELEGRRIGFIAQEVERVLPDWIAEKEDGTKHLTIRGFEALAVEALRELEQGSAAKNARIAELEQHGRELEQRVAELERFQTQVEALSSRLAALER